MGCENVNYIYQLSDTNGNSFGVMDKYLALEIFVGTENPFNTLKLVHEEDHCGEILKSMQEFCEYFY